MDRYLGKHSELIYTAPRWARRDTVDIADLPRL